MKVKQDKLDLWIKDLRSGNFKQGFGTLEQNGENCCLGVMCHTAIKDGLALTTGNTHISSNLVDEHPNDEGVVSFDKLVLFTPKPTIRWLMEVTPEDEEDLDEENILAVVVDQQLVGLLNSKPGGHLELYAKDINVTQVSLDSLNDVYELTFSEIADVLDRLGHTLCIYDVPPLVKVEKP